MYDSAGAILYHPDSSLQMTLMTDVGYSNNMLTALSANAFAHAMEYTRKGIEYCGSVRYIESTGWKILACMPYEEFNHEVGIARNIVNASFGLCIVILSAIIVLVALAIITPIKVLNTAVGKLAEGDLDVEINAKSQNEIGQLADSVVRLVDRLKTYILYINEISVFWRKSVRAILTSISIRTMSASSHPSSALW